MRVTRLVLWLSLGSAQIAILAASLWIPPGTDPSVGPLLVLPALAVSLMSTLLPWIPSFARQPAQTVTILRCALAESAGLMGLVAWIASGDHRWQLLCAGPGALAWLAAAPLSPGDLAEDR